MEEAHPMPQTCRAAVMPGPGQPIELRDIPLPRLEPGAALLHTSFSEVCGTDVHLHHGRLAGVPWPIIPGHVSVGVLGEIAGHQPRERLVAPGQDDPELERGRIARGALFAVHGHWPSLEAGHRPSLHLMWMGRPSAANAPSPIASDKVGCG